MQTTLASDRLVSWWRSHKKSHRHFPFEISYHHRSDEHANIIPRFVLEDLTAVSELLARHVNSGEVCCDFNRAVSADPATEARFELVIRSSAVPSLQHQSAARIALKLKVCMTNFSAS